MLIEQLVFGITVFVDELVIVVVFVKELSDLVDEPEDELVVELVGEPEAVVFAAFVAVQNKQIQLDSPVCGCLAAARICCRTSGESCPDTEV